MFVLRECFRSMKRSPMSVVLIALTIGVGLGLTAIFGYVAYAAHRALTQVESSISIDVYFDADLTDEQAMTIFERSIRSQPDLTDIRFISKEDALREYEVGTGQDVRAVLGNNPLPAGANFKLTEASTPKIDAKITGLRAVEGVDDVIADLELSRSLREKSQKLSELTLWLGGSMLAVILIVVIVATQLAVELRKQTIRVMSLLGATRWKIYTPLLLEGLIAGSIGGGLAVGLLIALDKLALGALIPDIQTGMPVETGILLLGTTVLSGAILGVLGSAISLISRRFGS